MPDLENTENLMDLLEEETGALSKRERTRLKIMASAAKVFSEKGFSEASVKDIADDAGIAKGTIYYYVDKKEDLLIMLVQFGQARLFSKIEKGMGKAATASEKIEIMIRNHLKIMKVVGPIMPFFVQNLVIYDSKLREVMAGFRERLLDIMAAIIEEGIASGEFRPVDPKKSAVAIAGMVIGQLMQHKVFAGKINTKEILETTIDIAIKGLRRPHED